VALDLVAGAVGGQLVIPTVRTDIETTKRLTGIGATSIPYQHTSQEPMIRIGTTPSPTIHQ
jgi:hypothetical protein